MSTNWNETLAEAAAYLSDHDDVLAEIIARGPLPTFRPHTRYYQEIVESIVSQQLSVKAAATILKRFKELFQSDFPTPSEILEKDIETFRSVGLSRPKASYILDLAEKVETGVVKFDHLDSLTNEEVIDELIQIKGVGVWTVHMFLIFCMGRLDVLPTGDLGIKNGIQKLYGFNEKPTAEEMEKVAKDNHWHPYQSLASWYVWFSLDNKPPIDTVNELDIV